MYAVMINPNTNGSVHIAHTKINRNGITYTPVTCRSAAYGTVSLGEVESEELVIEAMTNVADKTGRTVCSHCVKSFSGVAQIAPSPINPLREVTKPVCLCTLCDDILSAVRRLTKRFGVQIPATYPHNTNTACLAVDHGKVVGFRTVYQLRHAINERDVTGMNIPRILGTLTAQQGKALLRQLSEIPRRYPAAQASRYQLRKLRRLARNKRASDVLVGLIDLATAETEATDLELILVHLV